METLRLARFPPSLGRNPYLRLLDDGLRANGVDCVGEPPFTLRWLLRSRDAVDVLHFHWRPDHYYAPPRRLGGVLGPALFAWRMRVARLLGYRLVWTIHEVFPPRPSGASVRRADRVGSRLLARGCDLLLAHDRATADRAAAELGIAAGRIRVIPHPSYLGVYEVARPRAEVRAELGIDAGATVFLCFGALRADKAIGRVLEAFRGIESAGVALVVAGAVEDAASGAAVLAAAGADGRIRPLLDRVPHERVGELHAAADACVLGRGEAWTSGSTILALSLGVPVVAADLPTYRELTGNGRAGWLFRPGDAGSLRAAMEAVAADREGVREKGRAALEHARRLPSWSEAGERTAALIRQLGAGRRRSTDAATSRSAGVFTP